MKKYKQNIKAPIALTTLVVAVLFLGCIKDLKKYKVKVIFCDSRESVIVETESRKEPSTSDIDTYNEALSRWQGYLNVCALEVVK